LRHEVVARHEGRHHEAARPRVPVRARRRRRGPDPDVPSFGRVAFRWQGARRRARRLRAREARARARRQLMGSLTLRLRSASTDETRAIAAELGALLEPRDLVVLAGDLGAGKTTFAQGLARGLGVTEPVTSPTFTIVQEYAGRCPVAHLDVYRLERF